MKGGPFMPSNHPFTYDVRDRGLLQSVLNEVLNGFALDNFDVVIGMKRSELGQLLAYLNELPGDAEVDLNLTQVVALRNALRETLRELGIEEFSTRTGYDFQVGEVVLEKLNQFISANEHH
jgi:hypothetical protein